MSEVPLVRQTRFAQYFPRLFSDLHAVADRVLIDDVGAGTGNTFTLLRAPHNSNIACH